MGGNERSKSKALMSCIFSMCFDRVVACLTVQFISCYLFSMCVGYDLYFVPDGYGELTRGIQISISLVDDFICRSSFV